MTLPAASWTAFHFFYHADPRILLRHFARPLLAGLLAGRLVDGFFFVIYGLGGPHVRLRFRPAPGASAALEAAVRQAAAAFLAGRPSAASLDPEAIRRQSLAILEAAPEAGELVYPDNHLEPFAFHPEWERYGGEEAMEDSLDFFSLSSVRCLELLGEGEDDPGRRFTTGARALLQQASSFAADGNELFELLSYRLPLGDETVDALLARADQAFDRRPDAYRLLVAAQLARLGGAGEEHPAAPRWFGEGAARLSAASRGLSPARRWSVLTSQQHMTANRLGHPPGEELYLQRLLWRAARDVAQAEPAAWREAWDRQRERLAELERARRLPGGLLREIYDLLRSPAPQPSAREAHHEPTR